MALQIPTVSIDDLRQFHATHFPHAPVPKEFLRGVETDTIQQDSYQEEYGEGGEADGEFYEYEQYYEYEEEELGHYPDGVKRIVPDHHIEYLRHLEIHSIMRERQRQRDDPSEVAIDPTSSEALTPSTQSQVAMSLSEGADKVQAGRVEKPDAQKWVKTGAKTKARNAKNRKKNRLNHRARKKEERKEQKKQGKQAEEDEESDEWDPWHQANGPDAQKESTVDLDY